MNIELKLDGEEKKLLWILGRIAPIKLNGMLQMQLLLDDLQNDEDVLRHVLNLKSVLRMAWECHSFSHADKITFGASTI